MYKVKDSREQILQPDFHLWLGLANKKKCHLGRIILYNTITIIL